MRGLPRISKLFSNYRNINKISHSQGRYVCKNLYDISWNRLTMQLYFLFTRQKVFHNNTREFIEIDTWPFPYQSGYHPETPISARATVAMIISLGKILRKKKMTTNYGFLLLNWLIHSLGIPCIIITWCCNIIFGHVKHFRTFDECVNNVMLVVK